MKEVNKYVEDVEVIYLHCMAVSALTLQTVHGTLGSLWLSDTWSHKRGEKKSVWIVNCCVQCSYHEESRAYLTLPGQNNRHLSLWTSTVHLQHGLSLQMTNWTFSPSWRRIHCSTVGLNWSTVGKQSMNILKCSFSLWSFTASRVISSPDKVEQWFAAKTESKHYVEVYRLCINRTGQWFSLRVWVSTDSTRALLLN